MSKAKKVSFLQALIIIPLLSVLATPVLAQSIDDAKAAINRVLITTQPHMAVISIEPGPVDNLYEVTLQNGQTMYASADGKYFIPGDLYEFSGGAMVNLGEIKRNEYRAKMIAQVPEEEMIIYSPVSETKAVLTVFTDVDCPYCRKLHADIGKLNDSGIEIRYLAYPRNGLDTETYDTMVGIWCSENRESLFTSVVRGGVAEPLECDNPIARHYELGQASGVTGTPALVFDNGVILPGYVEAETLVTYLLSQP